MTHDRILRGDNMPEAKKGRKKFYFRTGRTNRHVAGKITKHNEEL